MRVEGFVQTARHTVGVPYFIWTFDVDLDVDRELRLVEQTILSLVGCGVTAQAQLAELMGLKDGAMLPSALVDLCSKSLLTFDAQGAFNVTPTGADAVARSSTREPRRYTNLRVCHDPYVDRLYWLDGDDDDRKSGDDVGDNYNVPAPLALSNAAFESRYREVQLLIDNEGLPFDPPLGRGEKRPRRDVVRLVAVKQRVEYRHADLEIWDHSKRHERNYCVMQGGGEQPEISDVLNDLAADGQVIDPAEASMLKRPPPSGTGKR